MYYHCTLSACPSFYSKLHWRLQTSLFCSECTGQMVSDTTLQSWCAITMVETSSLAVSGGAWRMYFFRFCHREGREQNQWIPLSRFPWEEMQTHPDVYPDAVIKIHSAWPAERYCADNNLTINREVMAYDFSVQIQRADRVKEHCPLSFIVSTTLSTEIF